MLRHCRRPEPLQVSPNPILLLHGELAISQTLEEVDDVHRCDIARISLLAIDARDNAIDIAVVLLDDRFAGDDEATAVLDLGEPHETTTGCDLLVRPSSAYGREGRNEVKDRGLRVLIIVLAMLGADEGLGRLDAAVDAGGVGGADRRAVRASRTGQILNRATTSGRVWNLQLGEFAAARCPVGEFAKGDRVEDSVVLVQGLDR